MNITLEARPAKGLILTSHISYTTSSGNATNKWYVSDEEDGRGVDGMDVKN